MSWYNIGVYRLLNGTLNLANDTIKVMLVTADYSFSKGHTVVSQAAVGELKASGYAGGFAGFSRKPLIFKTFTASNPAKFSAANLVWYDVGNQENGPVNGAVLIREATTDEDSLLIARIPLSNLTTTRSDITVKWGDSILEIGG